MPKALLSASLERPSFLIPARSSRHRIACLALYKHLLRLSSLVPIPPELAAEWGSKNPIAYQVRNAFKRNKPDTSPRLVAPAMRAGYETLALLKQAQDPNTPEHARVLGFLSARRAERRHTREAQAQHPPHSRHPRPPSSAPLSGATPLLVKVTPPPTAEDPQPKLVYTIPSRPRKLSDLKPGAVRKVPVLDMASDFPFLRLMKPQPRILSRVLRQKVVKRETRMQMVINMQEQTVSQAEEEDEWDELMGKLLRKVRKERGGWEGIDNGNDRHIKYAPEVYTHGIGYLIRLMTAEREDQVARAQAMRALILEEQELAKQERDERRRLKNERWEARAMQKYGKDWKSPEELRREKALPKSEPVEHVPDDQVVTQVGS